MRKFYITHIQLERLEDLGFESDGLPTQHEVLDWLREERQLHIFTIPNTQSVSTPNGFNEIIYPWKYGIANLNIRCIRNFDQNYITYGDCINNAINSAIDILEAGWDRSIELA